MSVSIVALDAERTGPVRVELLTPPEKLQAEVAVEGLAAQVKPLPGLALPLNETAGGRLAEGVNITFGEEKACVRAYRDPMAQSLDGWVIPKDDKAWSVSTDAFEKFATGSAAENKDSALYLAHKACQEGTGLRMTVRLRAQQNVKSGLLLRAASQTQYIAALSEIVDLKIHVYKHYR